MYNVQLSSLNCTLLTWLGIPQCVTLISHLVWLASSRASGKELVNLLGSGYCRCGCSYFLCGWQKWQWLYLCGWQKMTIVIVFAWRQRKGTCQLVWIASSRAPCHLVCQAEKLSPWRAKVALPHCKLTHINSWLLRWFPSADFPVLSSRFLYLQISFHSQQITWANSAALLLASSLIIQ